MGSLSALRGARDLDVLHDRACSGRTADRRARTRRRQGGAEASRPAPHVPAQATDHLMHQLHFFPSRTMALYVGRLFLLRSFPILFALVMIPQPLTLICAIGKLPAVSGH